MCGIIGYIGGKLPEGYWGQSHRLIEELLVAAQARGTDATGVAAAISPYEQSQRIRGYFAKLPGPASDFVASIEWRRLRHSRCRTVIGHTRWSTGSSPQINDNNHPFIGKLNGRRFALVHNGIISDADATAKRLGLKLHTDTDSEVACRLIEQSDSIPMGLHCCLRELKGSMAFAVVDFTTGAIWLARDTQRPLWVAHLVDRKRTVFASTPEIIAQAISRSLGNPRESIESIYPLAAHYVHSLTSDGRLVAPYGDAAILEAG
jgi:glucosamine 6-phosphate synthetase-like amidotransferase/phosphosugar isomerase protein